MASVFRLGDGAKSAPTTNMKHVRKTRTTRKGGCATGRCGK